MAKHSIKLMKHMTDALNASLDYAIVNEWGYKMSTNLSQVNGLMGLMLRKEIAISGESSLKNDSLNCFKWARSFRENPVSIFVQDP